MSKTRYFIKCDNCGKKIYLGDPIYNFSGRCGTYCSAECFAAQYAEEDELTFSHADNCRCTVYKEEIEQVMVEKVSDPVELDAEAIEKLATKEIK